MNAIGVEHGIGETRHQQHVSWQVPEGDRELGEDLRQPVAVPKRSLAVHWRRHQIVPSCELGRLSSDQGGELLKHWLDSVRRRPGVLRPGNEVRDAGQDDDVGLRANALQRLGQHGKPATLKDLAAGHQRSITAGGWIHVALCIGVPQEGENVRHLEDGPPEQARCYLFSTKEM